ncbi:hypothetical protein [Agarilytica rhodophyticola]|uniref:hypothetical protein n=1 Tax=Agarilytica rhodophyticola TaxID=1737490 RepID=UPI000B344D91|nr:hypothetical protein [Agarilytica rhodophyticola]
MLDAEHLSKEIKIQIGPIIEQIEILHNQTQTILGLLAKSSKEIEKVASWSKRLSVASGSI